MGRLRNGLGDALMEAGEQANLVLPFAKVLYVNGQATEETVSAAERLARARGLHATIMPHWGELQLKANDKHGTLIAHPPTTVWRGDSRWHYRRDGGSLRPELLIASCRGLSVHGPGAWPTFS